MLDEHWAMILVDKACQISVLMITFNIQGCQSLVKKHYVMIKGTMHAIC